MNCIWTIGKLFYLRVNSTHSIRTSIHIPINYWACRGSSGRSSTENLSHTATAAQASIPLHRSCGGTGMEDFLPPSLRRFYTDEPSSGSLAKVKKTRSLYLSKTLDEKAEEARWYRRGLVALSDVMTWPEYADEMGLDSTSAKKSTAAPKADLSDQVSLWQGDITKLDIDVIVNAANRSLLGGGGVDGAIHRAAGSNLLQECRMLRGCETGDAKLTAGYLLPARYVLHTVGPMVNGSSASPNDREDLTCCYATCLERILEHNKHNRAKMETKKRRQEAASKGKESATKEDDTKATDEGDREEEEEASANGRQATEDGDSDILKMLKYDLESPEPLIKSIAFPCISTGVYGYPQEDACRVALGVAKDWLAEHPDEVERIIFCVYLDSDLKLYERLLPNFFPLDGTSSRSRNEEEDET